MNNNFYRRMIEEELKGRSLDDLLLGNTKVQPPAPSESILAVQQSSSPIPQIDHSTEEQRLKDIPDSSSKGITLPVPLKKKFDDLSIFYKFGRSDYASYGKRIPWLFRGSWVPEDYAAFLNAGTVARVGITTGILNILEKYLQKKAWINLNGVRREDLGLVLAFSSVPFENAPRTTPTDEDFYTLDSSGKAISNKIPSQFDLVCSKTAEKIGVIKYLLPRLAIHFSAGEFGVYRNGYKFTLGEVKLLILGSAIPDEICFAQIKSNLKFSEGRV